MNALLIYLLQVICISGLLYGYYHVALRNNQFHQYNRFYLLGAAVLSVVLPFLNIPVYFSEAETANNFVLQTLTVFSSPAPSDIQLVQAAEQSSQPDFSATSLLYLLYALIGLIVLTRVMLSLFKIVRMIRLNPVEKIERIKFINTSEPGTPYSFFRWLFWNRDISLQSQKGEQIFRHELFHIHQKHSLDVLFMELLTVVCWINPFFHLMKKEVRAIHEFLADRYAIGNARKWEYAELLLMQTLNTRQRLVHPFFHNQIKRRIAMITTSKKPSYRYIRKLMVLPLTAAAVAIFAFSYRKHQDLSPAGVTKPITVVIDAGHGGEDRGAITSDGLAEKDIVLAIAKKVKELNADPNITILLTRQDDVLPKLTDRTTFTSGNRADLFISLHLNAGGNKTALTANSGVEIYLPKKGHAFESESRILASILLNYLHPLHKTAPVIKQAETNIWVLERTECPAALVELGFMENKQDMAMLKDPARQDEIARNLLKTIDQYVVQKNSAAWEDRKQVFETNTAPQLSMNINSKKRAVYYNREKDISITAEKIIFHSGADKVANGILSNLYIIDGVKKSAGNLGNSQIVAEEITVYGANDPGAIKKYGEEARPGVIVFKEATVLPADTTKPDMIFTKTEIEPAFPGGTTRWKKYLDENLKGNMPELKSAKDGDYSVIVKFIVHTDGSISEINTLTNFGHGLEEEAVRLIKSGPKWVPAVQNGKQVNAYKLQPITFRVRNGGAKHEFYSRASTEKIPKVIEQLDISVRSATEMIKVDGRKLDPSVLYIGIDNHIMVSGGTDFEDIHASISQGSIVKKGDHFIVRVTTPGEAAIFFSAKGNSLALKKVVFKTAAIPSADGSISTVPKIGLDELRTTSVHDFLKIPPGSQIESFMFTIDHENGEIMTTKNSRNEFSPATHNLIAGASPGRLITVDNIYIIVDGHKKKWPSQAYMVSR